MSIPNIYNDERNCVWWFLFRSRSDNIDVRSGIIPYGFRVLSVALPSDSFFQELHFCPTHIAAYWTARDGRWTKKNFDTPASDRAKENIFPRSEFLRGLLDRDR